MCPGGIRCLRGECVVYDFCVPRALGAVIDKIMFGIIKFNSSVDWRERETFVCHHCGRPFLQEWALRRHRRTKHSSGNDSNTDADKYVESNIIERKSRTSSTGNSTQTTSDNGGTATELPEAKSVTGTINTENSKLATCGKGLSQRHNLQAHTKKHTGARPYECATCGKGFSQQRNLQAHTKKHTGARPYECATCGKGFSQRRNLQAHTNKHTGARPYECATCGRAFADQSNLQAHERTHSRHRPFECATCGRTFARRRRMDSHVSAVHGGDLLAHPCPVCEVAAFSDRDTLRRHVMAVHIRRRDQCPPARPGHLHQCEDCGKWFKRKDYLTGHRRLRHSDEKEFRCAVCASMFKTRGELREHHTRRHTQARRFECGKCARRFKTRSDWGKHVKRVHPGLLRGEPVIRESIN